MEFFQAFFLAVIQGITEFLPISSSGHLVLSPYIFDWDYRGLSFDVALHFGTVIAIIVFFWQDIVRIVRNAIPSTKSELRDSKFPPNLLWQLLIATIPAAVVGILISSLVEKYLHSPVLIAINLAVFGILLWISDRFSHHSEHVRSTQHKIREKSQDPSLAKRAVQDDTIASYTYLKTFTIGVFQAIALMPGVSRSGITITAGRFLGLNRENAARFSFLLGIPAMLGATVLEATKVEVSQIDLPFVLAIIISSIVGFFAIKYLIEYLKRGTLAIFAVYRIILALIVLVVYYAKL